METSMRQPLVSVLVPNYNYGPYLKECLDSILAQTYPNIEIIFSDNASTDESYDIALEYERKHRGKFLIWRHSKNTGPAENAKFCLENCRGDYIILFGSDDAMKSQYVERCVNILEKNQSVGFVTVGRDIVDENGRITIEQPFYNRSCVIPGEAQAAVFMMGGLCANSQIMYRAEVFKYPLGADVYFYTVGDWLINYVICCRWDMAYLRDPLVYYRMHRKSETNKTVKNMLHVFEQFLLFHAFDRFASKHDLSKPRERLQPAISKLANTCLRYCDQLLREDEDEVARKYLYLAPVFKAGIEQEALYRMLWQCLDIKGEKRNEILTKIDAEFRGNLRRASSYDPPEGAIDI